MNHAELMGLLESLRMLKNMNAKESIVEGDSKTVISWGRGDKLGSWGLGHVIHEFKALTEELKVVLLYAPRAQNFAADALAKWSVGQDDVFIGDHLHDY